MESTNTPPRQTLSYLTGLLASRRIRPNSKLGQNLLIDLNLMDLVVSSAQLNSDDMVLEVGCGTGSLTSRLVGQAGFVLGVEIDFSMADLAQEVVGSRENFSLIQCDVLAGKNKIRDEVLVQLEQQKTKHQLKQIKLVANLPFAVATPVIANLLINSLPIHLMVVMVQWEIGQKMASLPGGPDFGALSILVQSLAQVEILRKIPATAFWPKPKVDSAIVRITPPQPATYCRRRYPGINPQEFTRVSSGPLFPSQEKLARGLTGHARKKLDKKGSG